ATPLGIETVQVFASVTEPGAAPLLGDPEGIVLPENGDAMAYGAGGAGKTSLMVDLGMHLAAGDAWLGIPVQRPLRVLLIEAEGPRPPFRAKLRRRLDAWQGGQLGSRLLVVSAPWADLRMTREEDRLALAQAIDLHALDLVILGPLTNVGMDGPGTLQEVRDFLAVMALIRQAASRPI